MCVSILVHISFLVNNCFDPIILIGSLYLLVIFDGYHVAYNLITLSCILLIFIGIKFIRCHSCVMFLIKFMSIYND